MVSRVELFEQIRRDHRLENLSIRELAQRHGTHRRTVRQALACAVPPPRKAYPARGRPSMDRYADIVDGWLVADQQVHRKQRHTARRVWQRLIAEHGAQISEVTVSRYVAIRRRELGLVEVKVFVPQHHAPGAEAEVDFGEFDIELADRRTVRVWMFVMRLSHSGRAFHVAYGTQAQEAFLEGHVRAFAHLGGVPARIRYDNLKPAVAKVLKGRNRQETEKFIALRSHYGFDSFFCQPGIDGAHEKGGVEGEIGRFRRRHLVPVPAVASLDQLNELIAAADLIDDGRVIAGHHGTISVEFAAEKPSLAAAPIEVFDTAVTAIRRVDQRSRVAVAQCYYSVPVRYVGTRVLARRTATRIEIVDGATVIATHPRVVGRHLDVLDLDHYLEILSRKPGALPGAAALVQARNSGVFTDAHQRYWDAARDRHGDGPGTRMLIELLLAHRHLPRSAVIAAMADAAATGVLAPAAVIIAARRTAAGIEAPVAEVGALHRFDRPAPTLAGYDDLLTTAHPPATRPVAS
ncbi:IS21 family transposase [Williamsia muralis]|uniref:IS21 family transposase n=1 Tax=Williamsia marianensis TaxID=85044 RepID=UPI0007884621|nr:IS21 family transposase [Williamsia muralis]